MNVKFAFSLYVIFMSELSILFGNIIDLLLIVSLSIFSISDNNSYLYLSNFDKFLDIILIGII